jgi:hypothetical protein
MGRGCGVCDGRQVAVGYNDLGTLHPEVAATLVRPSEATTVTVGSGKLLEWVCPDHPQHPFRQNVKERLKNGCPVCAWKQIAVGYNDLATTHPELASELVEPSLSAQLTFGSNRKVAWLCSAGHGYSATVSSRTNMRSGCAECAPSGFSPDSAAWLYLLAMPGGQVLKYGISNDVETRLDHHQRQGFTEVVETIYFDVGADAAEVERRIKAHVKAQGWQPPMTAESMPYGGASETLSVHDVGEGFTLSAFVNKWGDNGLRRPRQVAACRARVD